MQYALFQGGWSGILTLSNVFGVVGFLAVVGSAWIILKSRGREEALASAERLAARYKATMEQYERERDDAQGKLSKAEVQLKEVTEERDTLRLAYQTSAGIVFKEVADFYLLVIKDTRYFNLLIADRTRLEDEVRRLTHGGASIHDTEQPRG